MVFDYEPSIGMYPPANVSVTLTCESMTSKTQSARGPTIVCIRVNFGVIPFSGSGAIKFTNFHDLHCLTLAFDLMTLKT